MSEALRDEGPGAPHNHRQFFMSTLEEVIKEIAARNNTVPEAVPKFGGYVEAAFLFHAVRCASWSLHEDLRLSTRKAILEAEELRKETAQGAEKLVKTNQEGAKALVDEVRNMKEASDASAVTLIRWQRWMTIATWAIAVANIAVAIITGIALNK